MLKKARSTTQVVVAATPVIVELPVPPKGLLHRLVIARINTGGGNPNLTAIMDARLYEAETAAEISAYASVADGRRMKFMVMPPLLTAAYSATAGHIVFVSDAGIPFGNQGSSRATKVRKLFLELNPGVNGEGEYEITWVTASDTVG